MKLLLTIWISMILTQEVFSSTLVRIPRSALSKPTSSVHTEYEATYEQKGKLGNGSFSSVSGKQEVVHDNCGDNWNAFADKCATLIKDLVASLANAVSSKPGDATNLQLRIKNTFKHIDNTDNCTCLNRTANALSGVNLASLFDNLTISTVAPTANKGAEDECKSGSCSDSLNNQTPLTNETPNQQNNDDNDSCDEDSDLEKIPTVSPVVPKQGPQNLALVNAENVDPELSDTSKELSTKNNRRQTKHPDVIGSDPVQLSEDPGTTAGNLPAGSNGIVNPSAATPVKLVEPIETPTEIIPNPQPQDIVKPVDPVEPELPVLPAKNNEVAKPVVLVEPASSVPTSAAQISSPQETVPESAPQPVYVAAVKPEIVPADDEDCSDEKKDDQAPVPVLVPAKPVTVVEPVSQPATNDEEVPVVVPNQTPVESPVAPPVYVAAEKPETVSVGDEDCSDDNKDDEIPTKVLTPVQPVAVVEPAPQSNTNGQEVPVVAAIVPNQTPVEPPVATPVQPVAVVEPVPQPTTKDQEVPVVAAVVPNQTPVETPVATPVQPVAVVEPVPQPTTNGQEVPAVAAVVPNQTPVATAGQPVDAVLTEPQTVPAEDEDCSDDNKDDETPTKVLTPVQPVAVVEPAPQPTNEQEVPAVVSNQTPVATGGQPVDAVLIEPQTVPSNDEDCSDDNKDDLADQDPKVLPVVPIAQPANGVVPQPQTPLSNSGNDEPIQTPVVIPVASTVSPYIGNSGEPESLSAVKGDNDEDCDEGKEDTASKPESEAAPQESDHSNDQVPVIVKPALPEVTTPDSDNVMPGSVVKQPPDDDTVQKNLSPAVPVINSNSNLPESSDPVSDPGTVNPSPVYKPLPAAPTPILVPSNNAVNNKDPIQPSIPEQGKNVFIVTPIPAYIQNKPGVVEAEDKLATPVVIVPKDDKISEQKVDPDEQLPVIAAPVQQTPLKPIPKISEPEDKLTQIEQQPSEILLTTPIPVQPIPVKPISGEESPQPWTITEPAKIDVNPGGNENSPVVVPQPVIPQSDTVEDADFLKPTTFQTTSTDPTPPKSIQLPPGPVTQPGSAPQDSDETAHDVAPTSPQTLSSSHDDDDDEDCCSCESCTEEEITNPKEYKEMACKDLEEAKRELKAIFDKIKKKLKCGRKAPQKVAAS